MTTPQRTTQFPLGRLVATPAALGVLKELQMSPLDLIRRHVVGDFGDCCEEDWKANEEAVSTGERIFSVYKLGAHTLWVITEADRSSTCVLLPDDY